MALFGKRENRAGTALERRDPKAATQSVRYISPGHPTPPDWDAANAFAVAYYMNVVVYACVRLHANVIASLPFRVGADPNKPKDYDPNAPLAKLLGPPPGGPAPKLSARRLWAWTVAQRIVTGRNGWEIERNGDAVAALWPLASSSLVPVKSESGSAWFKGFLYGKSPDEKPLGIDQVVYDWSPSGTDFREPESDLQAANLDVAVSIMQSRYDYAFLKNDARPPAIIVTEEFEDQDSFEAFKSQWQSSYGGVDNAGRAAFLEATGSGDQGVKGAVDVTVLGISPKDAQAAQRHTAAMERTAIGLGTPWSLLDASGRTFSNAGQEWTNWATTRVMPMCADFQDMVNMQLAPLLGDNVGWFDLERLGVDEQTDPVTAQVGAPALVQAQLMTVNEARADYKLLPVPDGDRMMTAEEIAALKGGGPQETIRAAADPARPTAREEPTSRAPIDGGGSAHLLPPPVDSRMASEARRSKLWNTTQGRVKVLERQWEKALRRLFARQGRSVVARLEGKRGRSLVSRDTRATADEVFNPDHWLAETEEAVRDLYEAVTAAGGIRISEMFGLDFDLEAAYAQDFIQARANQLAGQVTDTTYAAVKDALAEGVAEGESIPDIATRLRGVFEQASETRAVTIARTEVISGFNGSASLTAAQYGEDVVAGQEWIATRDARTRDSHAAIDGEVVGIDDSFSNGLAYPGDPNGSAGETINCRCTVAFLTPEEMGDRAPRMIERRLARAVFTAWERLGAQMFRRALQEAA